jgi:hypothetical protein
MLIKDKKCDYKSYESAARAAMGSEIETIGSGNPSSDPDELFSAQTLNITPSGKPSETITVDEHGIHGVVRDDKDNIAAATINPDGKITTDPTAKAKEGLTQGVTKMLQTFKDNLGCKN